MSIYLAEESSSVCLRCLTRVIFSTGRRGQYVATRAFSTQDRSSSPVPRPTAWATLLKSQYLGKYTSIVVLRDTEIKRRAEHVNADAVKNTNTSPVKMADLLASMEAEEGVRGLEDAHKAIEAMRPAKSVGQRLSQQRADDLVERMAQSFSKPQLTTYIAMRQASQILDEQEDAEHHTHVQYAPWRPMDENGNLAKMSPRRRDAKRQAASRKKLAVVILRTVWGMGTFEDDLGNGRLVMKIDSAAFDLLTQRRRDDSILSEIGRVHRIKVITNPSRRRITIAGSRRPAEEAATAIGSLLATLHQEDLDLRPLFVGKPAEDILPLQFVQHIGNRFDCFFDPSVQPPLFRMRALGKANADRCRRALYAAVDPAVGTEKVFVGQPNESNLLELSDGTPDVLLEAPIARLRTPTTLSKGDTPTKVHIHDHKLSPGTFHEALDFLGAAVSTAPGSTYTLSASIGHLGRWQNTSLLPTADRLLQEGRQAFMPTKSGIPELFARQLAYDPPEDTSRICVHLVPSPWHAKQNGIEGMLPRLQLTFDIDGSSRRVIFRSLQGTSCEGKADILLPGLSTDVRLESSAYVDLASQPSLASFGEEDDFLNFVKEVENTGSGYSKVAAPPFLEVKRSSVGIDGTNEDSSLVTYFTSGIELVQEFGFDFHGFKLTYTLFGPNETSRKRDILTLHAHPAPQQLDKSSQEATDFFSGINELLSSLNVGIRNRDWDDVQASLDSASDDAPSTIRAARMGE